MKVSIFSDKEISKETLMKLTFIISIIMIVFCIINIFLMLYKNFYVDLGKITVFNEMNNSNFEELSYYVCDSKHKIIVSQYEKIDNMGNKNIYIKCTGKFDFYPSSTIFSVDIDNKTDRVYLENKKGELKEIWNKNDFSLIVSGVDQSE